jgi:tRNA pseudouridine38-40 synthase
LSLASLSSAPRRNIKLVLEYDGGKYHGWQRQKNALTLQEILEDCLKRLTGEELRVNSSGRTDAGVHALGQVANFRTSSALPLIAFQRGLNSLLPGDFVVRDAAEAPDEFHARYSALAKTYEYRLLTRPVRSPFSQNYCWWLPKALDLISLGQATSFLWGEHDFSSFQASGSSIKNPVRRVMAAYWTHAPGGWLIFRITANGFLRGMVRALVGTLVEMGTGRRQPVEIMEILACRDRRRAGPSAPAQGLYLLEVFYQQPLLDKIAGFPPESRCFALSPFNP